MPFRTHRTADDEVAQRMGQCEAKHTKKFEKAKPRARKGGGQYAMTDAALDVQELSHRHIAQFDNALPQSCGRYL